MISGSIVLAGQLLGTAFACGLNLYATVALLGIASRSGLATLPPGMTGLENGIVIGSAAALYVVEFIVDRVPVADHVWEAVHTIIRPAAAALLTVLALQNSPLYLQLTGAAAAGAMALAAHGGKAGLRLIVSTRSSEARRRSFARTALSLLEDIGAVALVVAALLYPHIAVGITAASAVLMLLAGPRLWRAAILGLRAVVARTRGFFGARGWRSASDLPAGIRNRIPDAPLGRSPARVAAVAVTGLPHVGAYRNGWLVLTCDGPRFLYRSLFRTHLAVLPGISGIRLRHGLVTDVLDIDAAPNGKRSTRSFSIFLLKDGPGPHVTSAELTAN
ncbi:MAG TPA: DUF4126 domain-containing protein [Longimicrobiales bacterium]